MLFNFLKRAKYGWLIKDDVRNVDDFGEEQWSIKCVGGMVYITGCYRNILV